MVRFFVQQRAKHYAHINDEVLKPLTTIELETQTKTPDIRKIGDIYGFYVKLPRHSYFYDDAILHLQLSNPTVASNLSALHSRVSEHSAEMSETDDFIVTKVNEALSSRKLEYDGTGNAFFNIIQILSEGWLHYIHRMDASVVLPWLRRTYPRMDEGRSLYLAGTLVWEERTAGERDRVVEAVESLAADTEIFHKIEGLESSKKKLEATIDEIVGEAQELSMAIESDGYTGKADCCPTIWRLITTYWLS